MKIWMSREARRRWVTLYFGNLIKISFGNLINRPIGQKLDSTLLKMLDRVCSKYVKDTDVVQMIEKAFMKLH